MYLIKRFSDTTKGLFLIIMGVVLLLHALGILSVSLNFIVVLFAILLVFVGVYLIRDKVSTLINSKNNKP